MCVFAWQENKKLMKQCEHGAKLCASQCTNILHNGQKSMHTVCTLGAALTLNHSDLWIWLYFYLLPKLVVVCSKQLLAWMI